MPWREQRCSTRKGAGIGIVVISSPSRRAVGKTPKRKGLRWTRPPVGKAPPVPFCAKLRSGSRHADFVQKLAENLTLFETKEFRGCDGDRLRYSINSSAPAMTLGGSWGKCVGFVYSASGALIKFT